MSHLLSCLLKIFSSEYLTLSLLGEITEKRLSDIVTDVIIIEGAFLYDLESSRIGQTCVKKIVKISRLKNKSIAVQVGP